VAAEERQFDETMAMSEDELRAELGAEGVEAAERITSLAKLAAEKCARVRSLEAQLSAQPKALEWRDPETAPRSLDDATPVLIVWNEDDDPHTGRCGPDGTWLDEEGDELFGVRGYLFPSDLPPRLPMKGETDG
jgi:hypothetical protein